MTKYVNPTQIFSYLQPSLFADSIYYADLFRFDDTIWMITGSGKSKAAQIFINKNKGNDLGQDSIAIKLENDIISGRYDSGAINPELKELHKFHEINYIAYCLTEDQSKEFKDSYLNKLIIMNVGKKVLAKFLSTYRYPGFAIEFFFSQEECIRLRDQKRRYDKFLEITNKCVNTKFVFVPWANTLEEKTQS